MATVLGLKDHLKDHFNNDDTIAYAIWQVTDVLGMAKSKGVTLEEKDAREILAGVHRTQDCEYGITWITLGCWIDEYEREKQRDEDCNYPRSDWEYEVTNGDTNLSYLEWLEHKRESFEDDIEEAIKKDMQEKG